MYIASENDVIRIVGSLYQEGLNYPDHDDPNNGQTDAYIWKDRKHRFCETP
ncbi:hypothetical protein YSY43_13900 [Paenibacillus sp. YSY-4.3]